MTLNNTPNEIHGSVDRITCIVSNRTMELLRHRQNILGQPEQHVLSVYLASESLDYDPATEFSARRYGQVVITNNYEVLEALDTQGFRVEFVYVHFAAGGYTVQAAERLVDLPVPGWLYGRPQRVARRRRRATIQVTQTTLTHTTVTLTA